MNERYLVYVFPVLAVAMTTLGPLLPDYMDLGCVPVPGHHLE